MPKAYSHSPLSRMRPRGAEIDGFIDATDMFYKLGTWLDETAGTKAYAYAYYPDFDTLSHRDGWDAPVLAALWTNFGFQLERFFDRLSASQRRNTLFLLTADHGHVVTPPQAGRFLEDYPGLLEHSALLPGGEARHVYLYARAGHKAELLAYAQAELANEFVVLDAEQGVGRRSCTATPRGCTRTPRGALVTWCCWRRGRVSCGTSAARTPCVVFTAR